MYLYTKYALYLSQYQVFALIENRKKHIIISFSSISGRQWNWPNVSMRKHLPRRFTWPSFFKLHMPRKKNHIMIQRLLQNCEKHICSIPLGLTTTQAYLKRPHIQNSTLKLASKIQFPNRLVCFGKIIVHFR